MYYRTSNDMRLFFVKVASSMLHKTIMHSPMIGHDEAFLKATLNRFRPRRQMWHVNKPLPAIEEVGQQDQIEVSTHTYYSDALVTRTIVHDCTSTARTTEPVPLKALWQQARRESVLFITQRDSARNLEAFTAHRALRDLEALFNRLSFSTSESLVNGLPRTTTTSCAPRPPLSRRKATNRPSNWYCPTPRSKTSRTPVFRRQECRWQIRWPRLKGQEEE